MTPRHRPWTIDHLLLPWRRATFVAETMSVSWHISA